MSYDAAELDEVQEWVREVTGDECPEFPDGWKNGLFLCAFANKLKPGAIPGKRNGKLPFHQMENIELFTNFVRALGLEDRNNFVTVDLRDEKDLAAVLKTFLCLKRHLGYKMREQKAKGDVFDRE